MSLDFANTFRPPRQDHGTRSTDRCKNKDVISMAVVRASTNFAVELTELTDDTSKAARRPKFGSKPKPADLVAIANALLGEPIDAPVDPPADRDEQENAGLADIFFEPQVPTLRILPFSDDRRGRALDLARRYDDADYAPNSRYGGDNPLDGFRITDRP